MKRTYRNAKYLAALLTPLFLATAATLARADEPRPDILIADFEGNDYGDWTATGDAFGESPATDEYLGGTGATFNVSGRKLVNTLANPKGDGATGTLTSPEFSVERDYIVFRVGGGKFPDETGVELRVDGEKVLSETGLYNESRKGDEGLARRVWDVAKYRGRKAQIVIFDNKAGGDWGHIKADRFVQTDVAPDPSANFLALSNGQEIKEYDRMIYGQFVEHFHRQVYGGLFEPGSPLSDETGFRKDVVEALRELRVPIVRWPGGCFVSAYHWLDGVGPDREPTFDKAWHVEDPNTFGTAEFVQWCRLIGAEPFICANAGTGTPEEMSDWVEYCNLNVGRYGHMRQKHGYQEPFNVKYWSIGNENWGGHEMGAKTVDEWGPLVRESGKLMINTDPSIKLFAAALPNENWTIPLLERAGYLLDYVSIHGYWVHGGPNQVPYLDCMARTTAPEADIIRTLNILDKTNCRGRVKIAFDEWNMQGWYHPGIGDPKRLDLAAREANDINSHYTMADAIFAARFLNSCLRHCDDVKIACFSPIVNVRGAIYAHPKGIVKRTTFHVFKMYSDLLEKYYVPIDLDSTRLETGARPVPKIDAVVTCDESKSRFVVAVVNLDPEKDAELALDFDAMVGKIPTSVRATILRGETPDDYNDVGAENRVVPKETELAVVDGKVAIPSASLVVFALER